MKKLIEKVVSENENIDIIDEVTRLAKENPSWIYLSGRLCRLLEERYRYYNYAKEDGKVFYKIVPSDPGLYVDDTYSDWNKLALIGKVGPNGSEVNIASDPEIVYFLS